MIAVLLDLDDTLLDNRGAERGMLDELAEAIAHELPGFDASQLHDRFLDLREPLFRRTLTGEWTLPQYREAHLRAIVEPWGEPTPALLEHGTRLRDELPHHLQPNPGADDLLATLKDRGHPLGLLTNGPSELQRGKLARAGWAHAFDALGISEELGVAKPDARAFHLLTDRLGTTPANAVMVGDNLVNDIAGALDAGLAHAIWTPAGPGTPPAGVPTADRLADIPALLDAHAKMDA